MVDGRLEGGFYHLRGELINTTVEDRRPVAAASLVTSTLTLSVEYQLVVVVGD